MLTSVRKAYLNVDTRNPPLLRQTNRTIDIAGGDQSWGDIRNLTNEERDQIDLQARVILSRCKDRVAQLEELEKRESSFPAPPQLYKKLPRLQARGETDDRRWNQVEWSSPQANKIPSPASYPLASAKTTRRQRPISSRLTTPP